MTKINIKSLFKAAIGFFVLIFFSYAYFFVYFKVQSLGVDIGSATKSITVINEKRKEFELAKVNLESQSENVAVIESAFFSENDFVNLLNTFESIGKIAGARFEAKGANLSKAGEPAEISFALQGSFNSIARFLTLLDNARYSGIINKFSLFENSKNSKVLTANIDYLIFNYK